MRLDDYSFELPERCIARFPPERRDGGRLWLLGAEDPHRKITDLPEILRPGDLLVVNDTRVIKARVRARRQSGGQVELLLLEPGPGPVPALVRPARKLKPGEVLEVGEGARVRLLERDGETWRVQCDPEPAELMERFGEIPLPPYLEREATPDDERRYQTVFAGEPGAVAAPTAGLHLGPELLDRLEARGVRVVRLTLHVGAGTFRNLRPEDLAAGELHAERFHIPEATVEAIAACTGRVIAVGTTSARALESAAGPDGLPRPGPGVTRLFIREGYQVRCVDGLMTNFHLPGTSLLMLVCALGGRERVLDAYRGAVGAGYRFFSYGDAMLLLGLQPSRNAR